MRSRGRIAGALWIGLGVAAGCKGKPTTAPPVQPDENQPEIRDDSAPPDPAPQSEPPPKPEAPRCGVAGTPWNGKPAECLYEHDGCCYPDPGSLCQAAKCADDRCTILESKPAQVRCRTEPTDS